MGLKQFVSLKNDEADIQNAWYRHLLTPSAGGLAVLSGLNPEIPAGIGKYFLAGTWIFLGLGIIAGASATYLAVDSAKKLAQNYKDELQNNIEIYGKATVNKIVVANPAKIFSVSRIVMIISLLLAVCCLVTYSVLITLCSC